MFGLIFDDWNIFDYKLTLGTIQTSGWSVEY